MVKKSVTKDSQGVFQVPCSTSMFSSHKLEDANQSLVFTAITKKSAIWKAGEKGTITVTFGTNGCRGCSPDAAWSMVGSESKGTNPSMNLGFIDPPYGSFEFNGLKYNVPADATRNYCKGSDKKSCKEGWVPGATVIHEFCHALGMLHEHQNNLENSNPIELNIPAVNAYYNKIGLGSSGAVTNVINTYTCTSEKCEYSGTKYDPKSIMLYYLPNGWVKGKNPTSPNFTLSSGDKGWLKNIYPKSESNQPEITVKFVDINPPSWKVAWVIKNIKETFEPLLGIKWKYDTPSSFKGITKSSNEKTTVVEKSKNVETTVTDENTGTTDSQPLSLFEPCQNNNSCLEGTTVSGPLLGFIIGMIIAAIVLLFGSIWLWKRRKARRS